MTNRMMKYLLTVITRLLLLLLPPAVSPVAASPVTASPVTATTDAATIGPSCSCVCSPTLPTTSPSLSPTISPTVSPTLSPTISPTIDPTISPTIDPTTSPTTSPTISPTIDPTTSPTIDPTISHTISPTVLTPEIACACREPNTLQRGHGCDGIDNTCDPDKQIDECEEDIIPPEIDASEAVSLCKEKIYTSADDALECFEGPGLVTATDDCKEVDLSFIKTDAEDGCSTTVHIKAEALGCGKRPEEDTTVLDVNVSIDEDPPKVECNLLAQDLTGTGAFTDLGFWFSAVDGGSVGCTATEDLAISIKVYSNEVVETGKEMLSISTPLPGIQGDLTTPAIWAEDHVCKSATYGQCKIPSPKKLRQYLVVVAAIDEAGNSGNGSCDTKIRQGTSHSFKSRKDGLSAKSRKDVENDPLFLIGEIELVGGVEKEEDLKTRDVAVAHRGGEEAADESEKERAVGIFE